MSEQDETMRLAAEIVNKWSGPLNDMRRDLRKLADDVKGTHAAGVTHAKKHGEAISGVRREFQRLDEHVKSTSLQTMAAFGLSALSVASAVSAVKDSVFGFGDSTRQMTFLRRETGLAIDQLRQYEELARRVGAAPGAMSQGIENFAEHLQNLRQLAPKERNAFLADWDKNANQFLYSLLRMKNPEALSAAIGFLDHIPVPQHKKKWLRMLGLPENLADVPVAELRKQMAEIQKSLLPIGPDAEKAALKFEDAINRMHTSIENLKLTVGLELADAFSDATDQIREFVDENRTGLIGVLKDVSSGIHTALTDARELMQVYRELRGGEFGPSVKKFLGEKDVDSISGGLDWLSKHSGQGQRLWDQLKRPSDVPPGADFMPMAYHPGGGGLRSGGAYTMMGAGAPSGSPEEVIAKGTHAGVLQALRDFRAEVEGSSTGAGGGGGMMAANYSPGGGGGGGGGISGSLRRSLGGAYAPSGAGSGAGGARLRSDIGAAGVGARGDGAVGPGVAPSSAGGNMAGRVAAAWRAAGMSEAGVAGILGNVQQESNFNPSSRAPDQPHFGGEAHFAHGLYQEGGTEWNNYAAWLQRFHPGADWRNPDLQSTFAAENLKARYPGTWEAMKNAKTPEEAAEIYERGYLRPAPWAANLAGRQRYARHFFQNMPPLDPSGVGHGLTGYIATPGGSYEGLHGSALRAHFGYRGHGGNALQLGKQSGLYSGGRLQGNASVHVRFENPPKGMRTKAAASGLFNEVKLSRGRTMVAANQDS
jgi:hypothetical protein